MAVAITLIIGLFFSLGQIVWDLHEERGQIDRTVKQVLSTLRDSATQAAYGLDETLAARVVSGLFEYEPVYDAVLRDNFGNILAEQRRALPSSGRSVLTDWIFGNSREYEVPLRIGPDGDLVGMLLVHIDTDLIANAFLNRATLILTSGILRNLLLGLVLVAFFYLTLTKPLLRISGALAQIDTGNPVSSGISVPHRHHHDELGLLSRSVSGLIDGIADTLARLRHTEQQVRDSESRMRAIVQNVADGILSIRPDGRIVEWNQAALPLLGFNGATSLAGRSLLEFVAPHAVPGLENALARAAARDIAPVERLTLPLIRSDGREMDVNAAFRQIPDPENPLLTVVLHDVTARRRYEERLVYMANHDALTDLPNRSMLEAGLNNALALHRLEPGHEMRATAVLFIDLDRFKLINDSLGHDVGDLLLKAVADRLRRLVGRNEVVGRLGGDEFLIIMPDLRETQDAANLSQAVLDALNPAFEIDGRVLFITPSIGIALYPSDGQDFPTLMRNADTAMYGAKARGGGTYHFFTKTMNESAVARLSIENDLREAIIQNQFELYYQPKIDLLSGALAGLEALIRWNQPGHGMISPMQFIPVAEETGLIGKIGEWVLNRVCEQISEWDAQGFAPGSIAVNLSPRQLVEGRITETVSRILERNGTSGSRIVLEVTESVMVQEMRRSAGVLDDLRKLGLQIAIDDFGTGYSSLAYLKRLPINSLKIDRSFVRDVTTDPDDAAITSTIITMGHNLGLRVVAEGVETHEQLEFLREHGCDEIQGFLISEPRPAIEIATQFKRMTAGAIP